MWFQGIQTEMSPWLPGQGDPCGSQRGIHIKGRVQCEVTEVEVLSVQVETGPSIPYFQNIYHFSQTLYVNDYVPVGMLSEIKRHASRDSRNSSIQMTICKFPSSYSFVRPKAPDMHRRSPR